MPEKPIREQLTEARSDIQREIDTLRIPSIIGYGFLPSSKLALIQTLKANSKKLTRPWPA
jgi:hypothetical protein